MRLAHTDFGGEGLPIVILHALFASAKNWASVGRALAARGHAYALDLRNHGHSPRAASHSLRDLVADLEEWVADNLGHPPVLLGHSMGGLTVMAFALRHPERTRALVVVDIAPRAYGGSFERELQALRLDLSHYRTRAEVDRVLAPLLPDPRVRQFFQTGIEAGPLGFRWMTNGEALEASRLLHGSEPELFAGSYAGPVLVVAGGASPYVRPEDHRLLADFFPNVRIEVIPEADHWVQASSPAAFRAAVERFLDGLPLS